MYPAYLVLLTSASGVLAARRLSADGLLSPSSSWVLHALHAAKLCMVALPEASLVLPAALLALAASAPAFVYEAQPGASASAAPPSRRRLRLLPWQGLAHVISVLVSVALARFAVFDVVQVGGKGCACISNSKARLATLFVNLCAVYFFLEAHRGRVVGVSAHGDGRGAASAGLEVGSRAKMNSHGAMKDQ